MRRLLSDFGAEDADAAFGEDVTVTARLLSGQVSEFAARLTDVTAGTALLREIGTLFAPAKII